ncbi:hypothetical protein ABTL68_19845, partial [Acinetobacter baumannii]
ELIADFISKQFDVESVQIQIKAEWNIVTSVSTDNHYGYRFWPDKLKGEGFYITVFRKKSMSDQDYLLNKPLTKANKQET